MAGMQSFDIESKCDLQEVDNAINQARKELGQRFDFKGVSFDIDLDRKTLAIKITAPDLTKLNGIWDILAKKMMRRGVPVQNLEREAVVSGTGGVQRQNVTLTQGISGDVARKITGFLKNKKYKKVQAIHQEDGLRVSAPSRDTLQQVMSDLRQEDFGLALQFANLRGR